MRAVAAGALVLCLLTMAFGGLQPSFGEGGGPPEEIGQYQQLGQQQGLTPDHVSWQDGKLKIEGPPLANELRVNVTFVANELGAWASATQFTPADGAAVFEGRTAIFMPLELGPEPVFTWGDNHSVEFLARPMWINVTQDEYGGTITLDLEDDDPTGQTLYVSKAWLWERGIHRPNATHEDGTVLNVTKSEDGEGFLIDVHHFSTVEINPADLQVLGRSNGMVSQHDGERRWIPDKSTLEIDVAQRSSVYEVMIDKDWIDARIAFPQARSYSWSVETFMFIEFYVVQLQPPDTPVTLYIHPHALVRDGSPSNDPYQEFKFINMESLQAALGAGSLVISIFNENLILNSEHHRQIVNVDGDEGNSTFARDIYYLENTNPLDNMTGDIVMAGDDLSLTMIFTSPGKYGSYLAMSTNITQMVGRVTYREVHFFDPINESVEFPFTGESESPLEDPIGHVLAQDMKFRLFLDREAIYLIWDLSGHQTIAGACEWVSTRMPRSTSPYTAIGVKMELESCSGSYSLTSSYQYSACETLFIYYHQQGGQTLNEDIVVFLSGYTFRDPQSPQPGPRGCALPGPESLNQGGGARRYSVSTINPVRYPDGGTLTYWYAATLVILHEMGHNMRADHYHAVHIECDRTLPWEPVSGWTIMGFIEGPGPVTSYYCFMFSDEQHSPTPAAVCGQDGAPNVSSGKRIRCGSFIYWAEADSHW